MKKLLEQTIIAATCIANKKRLLPSPITCNVELKSTKNQNHGNFSTNLAMKIAKTQKMPPKKIAQIIADNIKDNDDILEKIEVAGAGFINFFIKAHAWHSVLKTIHERDWKYGCSNMGLGQRVQIEYVSSNPTGPLHVGHGRGAAVGDSMANILSACGFDVQREYYINDSGRQISTLGLSVYLRAKEILNNPVDFPEKCYQGNYIKLLARELIEQEGPEIFEQNQEQATIKCANYASKKIIKQIREDLNTFNINFDCWFSEQSLYDNGKVNTALEYYRNKKLIYEQDGAQWFATSNFGDEKDRVVVKKNGMTTYFASDIAYHKDKFDRGFEQVIDVWGADHHGYIPRIEAAVKALKKDKKQIKIILVRLVNLLRDGEPIAMSTRSGKFVTLRNVIDEVGADAARFLFLSRHHDSPLDFDLELAKKKSNENPVYYVQYVHARISNVLNKGQSMGIDNIHWNESDVEQITSTEEIRLMEKMSSYPKVVENACQLMEPHRISFYLVELASNFHTYYNKERILTNNLRLTRGRLCLILAVQKTIRNGLKLLGVSTPDKM